jgi:DeoR/GlpR family transcriptional regulator of sugar metabolism
MRQPAKTIQRKQFVFTDGGTTDLAAVRIIPERLSTIVATQYPDIAAGFATRQDITLIGIGGQFDLI